MVEGEPRLESATTFLPVLVTGILLGSAVSFLLSTENDRLWPLIYLSVITLPLLWTGLQSLIKRRFDLFAPNIFFPSYLWLHIGLGTFLFMANPIRDLTLPRIVPLLNIGAVYAFFLGLLFFPVLKHFQAPRPRAMSQITALFRNWSTARLHLVFLGGLLVSFLAAALFFTRAGGIPILFQNVEEGRVEAIRGNAYIAFVALSISYFFLAYWAQHLASGGKPFSLRMVFLFAIVVLIQVSFGYRNKLVWFVVTLLVAYNYLYRRLKLRYVVYLGLLMLILVVLAGIWRASTVKDEDSLNFAFAGILGYGEHMFKRSTVGLIAVTEIFPEQESFSFGRVYISHSLNMLLPGHQLSFGQWLKEATRLEFSGGGLPPSLVGEFYLNFGMPGVLIGFFLVGLVLSGTYTWMRKYPSVLRVLIYAVLIRNLGQSVSGGFSGTIGIHLLWSIFLILAIHWFVYRPKTQPGLVEGSVQHVQ
jgi:oligosaccharide repeat unit polymerase